MSVETQAIPTILNILFGDRSYARTTMESLQRPIMTSGAGCPLRNNPTIYYSKLKQKRHYQ